MSGRTAMKVTAIADIIKKAQEDGAMRRRIIGGELLEGLSEDEKKAVREAVLRMEKGESVPPHMLREEPAVVWFAASVTEIQSP